MTGQVIHHTLELQLEQASIHNSEAYEDFDDNMDFNSGRNDNGGGFY